MTKPFFKHIACPNCGYVFSAETAFQRWVRNNKRLDSIYEGLGVLDDDMNTQSFVFHRYRTIHGRGIQFLLQMEVKEYGGKLSFSQRDTLTMQNQFLRNRRNTPTKKVRYQAGSGPQRVWSPANKKYIRAWHFGVHLLRFEKTSPDDSAWIRWDGKEISKEILEKLLLIDVDPDTFIPIEEIVRIHHKKIKQQDLPLEELGLS